jgi:chemotaxis protein methyltransferase CheR
MIEGQEQSGGTALETAKLYPDDIVRIAELALDAAGIVLTDDKSAMIQSRLTPRLLATQARSFKEYLDLIQSDSGRDERDSFLRALTTNLTRFYREPHHFVDFRENFLPSILPSLRQGGRLRVWSSACSTGEEPYSIAFEVLKAFGQEIANLDVRILATDIDRDVVAKASAGVYAEHILRHLPEETRSRFFIAEQSGSDRSFRVAEAPRDLIRFRELNLLKPWPMQGRFDAIFCRNVMIYFTRETQEVLLERFAAVSKPNARLYIGHSERVTGPAQSVFRNIGMTTYMRRETDVR